MVEKTTAKELEVEITAILRKLAWAQYILMQKRGDFGAAGRERTMSGFCRNVLHISHSDNPGFQEYAKLQELQEKDWGELNSQSMEELEREIADTGLVIGDTFFRKHQVREINEALEKAGSIFRFFNSRSDEKYQTTIWGPAKEKKIGEYHLILFEEEVVRTPAAILPMVAIHGFEKQVILRREACEVIYTEKWAVDDGGTLLPSYSTEVDIREAIKQMTLHAYKKPKAPTPEKLRALMVDEMLETTGVHEACHGAVNDALPSKSHLALEKVIRTLPYATLIRAIDEVLAEWMPKNGPYEGAIPYIAAIGKKDPAKGKRLLFRYISDSWFLGNWDQSYLNDITELFISTLLPYIENPEKVNFDKMLRDAEDYFQFFFQWLVKILDHVESIFQDAQFNAGGIMIDYSLLKTVQQQEFAKQGLSFDPGTEGYERFMWFNMLRYLEKTAPTEFTKLKNFLADTQGGIKKDLLAKLTDKAEPGTTLREWLISNGKKKLAPREG